VTVDFKKGCTSRAKARMTIQPRASRGVPSTLNPPDGREGGRDKAGGKLRDRIAQEDRRGIRIASDLTVLVAAASAAANPSAFIPRAERGAGLSSAPSRADGRTPFDSSECQRQAAHLRLLLWGRANRKQH
jgi:hypothetical protein